jgi:1,4-alpha-glucan branching enzyme
MWVWVCDGATLEREIAPGGRDDFGVYYDLTYNRSSFNFLFKDGRGKDVAWEDEKFTRSFHLHLGREIWSMSDRHNIYNVPPAEPRGSVKDYYRQISPLVPETNFYLPSTDVSGLGVTSMLGANILTDGSILFGFFHPYAARVYLAGNFNDWQCPGHPAPREDRFIPMDLHLGFYRRPNLWLARITPNPGEPVEYKFYLQGGAVENERFVADPYTRLFSDDFKHRNSVVVDPTRFRWEDGGWKTPDIKDLILYELNIYGFTDNDSGIPEEIQGTFQGVTHRIKSGFFDRLGVTALALMPTAEVPVKKGLGYEPCTFMAVEKDFGSPDHFREMVNEAHRRGLAVLMDQVFNHTSNDFNPLWNLIDDGSGDGGFYFAGKTMWGNKVATGKDEVDNMLIDACKLFIKEYHIDGFRFDATHSYFLNHRLLHRLAHQIKDRGFKPDAILIAENLPNERDLNLEGFNGYAQWSNTFHDKVKALLREGAYEGTGNGPDGLGPMIYFNKESFAAHTNNVVNYCESHDENSVQYEVATRGGQLRDPAIKSRKARLGLLTTMVALGQPMIYMGQEFGVERERNRIKVSWSGHNEESSHFYNWTRSLINLRKRYAALRLGGYNPADEGRFTWLVGPWMKENRGGQKRVAGWKVTGDNPSEKLLILLNFENHAVPLEVDFDPGRWVKLGDIDHINDLPPNGNKSPRDPDGIMAGGAAQPFVLPPYSGFIYKYLPA